MPEERIELSCRCRRRILSPVRLPVPPLGQEWKLPSFSPQGFEEPHQHVDDTLNELVVTAWEPSPHHEELLRGKLTLKTYGGYLRRTDRSER